ncbi:hypothetical protein D3C78_1045630 [compost metagenome]
MRDELYPILLFFRKLIYHFLIQIKLKLNRLLAFARYCLQRIFQHRIKINIRNRLTPGYEYESKHKEKCQRFARLLQFSQHLSVPFNYDIISKIYLSNSIHCTGHIFYCK